MISFVSPSYLNFLGESSYQSLHSHTLLPWWTKTGRIYSAFKKDDPLNKKNYHPISSSSHMLKTFGKMLFNKTNDYIKPFSSDLLTVPQRNKSTQYGLIKMLEKLKHLLDHHLFLANLDTYGFSLTSTAIIQN